MIDFFFLEMFKLVIFLLLIANLHSIYAQDDFDGEGEGDAEEELRNFIEKKEALQFFSRLFHPFSTKNEEIKRETTEVYEEKCRSIVPTQR